MYRLFISLEIIRCCVYSPHIHQPHPYRLWQKQNIIGEPTLYNPWYTLKTLLFDISLPGVQMETGAHYRHVARSIWRDPNNHLSWAYQVILQYILHSLVDSFENLEVVYTVLLKRCPSNMLDIMTKSYNELFCIDIEKSYVE